MISASALIFYYCLCIVEIVKQLMNPAGHRHPLVLSPAQKRVILRKVLREQPAWAAGHLRLGKEELLLARARSAEDKARSLNAIELSARAALKLLAAPEEISPRAGKLELEARYLLACTAFLNHNYEEALRIFDEITQPEPARLLSLPVYFSALETSAAAAMVAGTEAQAKELLLRLPESKRSPEAALMLEHLSGESPR